MLRRDALSALRPDRTFTAGKLGHLNGPALGRRSAWIFLRPSSLRRNHSRKRNVKPVPVAEHNTVPSKMNTDFEPSAEPRVWARRGGSGRRRPGRAASPTRGGWFLARSATSTEG